MHRRTLAVLLTALAAGALSSTPAQAAGCSAADTPPNAALGKARSATLCLLNAERARHGLPRLRPNRLLATAARRHSRDMVRRGYFAHDSLDGRSFDARIKATGYLSEASGWNVGENLAWGTGTQSTPRHIVAAWMASPSHRRNVLHADYRQIGIAIVAGSPAKGGGANSSTYATEFGRRS